MPSPSVTLVDVDGVPAFVSDIRTSYTGALTFGLGLRDETARTAGTAHLLEHLVMSRVGKVATMHNAVTSDETISFFAQGAPAVVAHFLTRVADAISTLHEVTDDDVDVQRRIIAAENGEDDERPGRGALVDRFGNQSIGLIDLGSPAHRTHSRSEVLAVADAWLHSGNAVLTFTGPIPDGFAVRLPSARPVAQRAAPATVREAAWNSSGPTPLTVSLVLTGARPAAAIVARVLLAEVLHAELRTAHQKIYSVAPFSATLAAESQFVAYQLDPRPDDAVDAAAGALATLRRLADCGPTDDELGESLDGWKHAEDDPNFQSDNLESLAASVLLGRRERSNLEPDDLTDVTAAELRDVFATSLATVFVTFGDEIVDHGDDEVTEKLGLPCAADAEPFLATLTKTELFRHLMKSGVETFSPRAFRGMRGCQLIVDDRRVTMIFPDFDPFEVRFDQVVMASYSEKQRVWSILARPGHALFVDLDQWREDKKMHALLSARLPASVQFRVDVVPA